MPRERGFILATTLLVMTLLTVMLTAAFVMISAEYRTTNGSYATTRSLGLAQAGLQSYLSQSHVLGSGYDSLNYAFPGGYSRVVARRLRDSTATEPAVWVVYSTGVDTTAALTSQASGQRVVAQLARLDPGTLPARAAMVAPNGVQYQSNGSNPINGNSLAYVTTGCVLPGSPARDTVGLSVGALTDISGQYSSPYPGGEGANGMEILGSASTTIDSTHIDWAALVSGEFTPDYYASWPPPCSSPSCVHQSYYWTVNATVPSGQRRGLLVATNDVILSNFAHWDGIIVAGGRLTTTSPTANYTIHGMVITGLNLALGSDPGPNVIRRGGGRTIQWSYCYARSSTSSLSYLVPIRGTFVDTWKTY